MILIHVTVIYTDVVYTDL